MVGALHGEDRGALAAAQELRVGHALELRDQARGGEEATVPQDADAVLVAGDHVAELVADEPRVRAVPVQEGQGLVAIGDRLGDGRQVELGDEDLPLTVVRARAPRSRPLGPAPRSWPLGPGTRSDVATSAQYCCDPYSCRGTAQGVRAMTEVVQSYAHGTSAVPLIGQTIGENLAATVARFPDHEALVVPFQDVRLTYAQLDAAVDDLARAPARRRHREGRPRRHLEPELRGVGARPVRHGHASAPSSSTSTRPTARTRWRYALNQSGCRLLVAAQSFKASDYVAMVTEVRPTVAALERVVFLGTSEWDELVASGATVDRRRAARRGRPSCSSTTRSTSSTRAARRASPRAPRSPTTTSSTTATSSARAAATTSATGSASPCPSTTASAW